MFSVKWIVGILFVTASAVLFNPVAIAKKPPVVFANDDEVFAALREAARNGDAARADELASRLRNYDIPSYVDYFRLKPRIATAPEAEIRDFLARYDGSAIGDRLRNDWLLELGRAQNWALFDEQFPLFVLKDDTQLKCYDLISKASKGRRVAEEARALLVAPQNYGEACPLLITTLVAANQFNADDVWAQVRLIAESGFAGSIRRIAAVTEVSESTLMQAMEKPDAVLARGPGTGRPAHETFVLALGRSARSNPNRAVDALVAAANRLNERELAQGWAQIALQASLKLLPEAAVYWHRTDSAVLSNDAYQWKARAALRAGEWKQLAATIQAMPASLRDDATWIYWLGRAYLKDDRKEEARKLFESIAGQTGFYGQLAQEELGRKIVIPPRAQEVSAEEIAPMAENKGFRRAFRFFDMDMRFEGYREWNWELRGMSERQHLAAAEFARQKEVLDRMVNTSDRTRAEVDFTQRFPSPFRSVMQGVTGKLGLDMAWVYGLIRQESRFILNARSHVGASGLMQLMPATAKYVARKIGLTDFSHSKVNDIDTNILLGTNYLNMVLNDLDGSQALATAGYNAGPRRSREWRAMLPGAVEGAVFAESIPFNETREYVKKVLSNATYYAALFEDKPQSLKARLGIVAPKDFSAGELP